MNKTEKRILNGLYFHREMIGEEYPYTVGEIRWLAAHSLDEGRNWLKDERLQTTDVQSDPRVSHFAQITTVDDRPLRYLEQSGYIRRANMAPGISALKISVTVAGADYARQLESQYGRLNLWYREHKDSLIGILIAVVVSAITAVITSRLTVHADAADARSAPKLETRTTPTRLEPQTEPDEK